MWFLALLGPGTSFKNSSEDGHDLGFHSKLEIIKKGGSSTFFILDILASCTFIYH